MNIRITGRSGDVTGAMKRRAQAKVSKLLKFYDRITWVDVVLDVAGPRRKVEVNAGLSRGTTLVGRSESEDMYAAIDLAVDKISRQLRRHKEKLTDHRGRRSDLMPEPQSEDESEPFYEDAIEEY